MAGGSLGEAIAAVAAIVLSIIALAGLYPELLLPIAALTVAGAFLFEGGAIAARYARVAGFLGGKSEDLAAVGGGMSVEFFAGVGGIVFGILSLLGIAPAILMPVAVLLFGCALAVGAAATEKVRTLAAPESERSVNMPLHELETLAMGGATSVRLLVGLGVIVLGILALVGVGNVTVLCLSAFLALGAALILSGTAVASSLLGIFQHR
ncbi:MAG: hypothetical protein ABFD92_02855 [Planctomycetaceae bacterium]|nr:hypothetical protein [Planctomycetaceae bacterium]